MSIAEQIMVGTQQQLGQTNILAQNLSALGQQVGRQLAINQYQKDAAAVLPAMRESYKSAFNKMGQGKYADGYMELLDTNLQFGATTNPFIAQFADQANQTAKQMERTLYREAQYGGRGRGGGPTGPMGFRVPSAEELSDPNATIESDVVYAEGGIPGMGGGTSFGGGALQGTEDQRRQQAEADRMYGAPMDPDAQAGRDLMALEPEGEQGGMSFGFGTISKFKPKDDVIKATQDEVASYKGLSPDDKADYTAKLIEDDADYSPPQGRKASPFAGIVGFEGVSFIEGPVAGGMKVTGVEEGFSQRAGKTSKRTMAPADPVDEKTFDAFVANLEQASRFASRNPQLRKIIEATGGDLTRIDFQDEENPDTGETVFKAFVDGADMGVLSTEEKFNEKAALEMLADAPAAINRNGWKIIKGQQPPAPAAAPAAGGDAALAESRKVFGVAAPTDGATAPAETTAPIEISERNPFAKQAKEEYTKSESSGKKSEVDELKKQLNTVKEEIKLLSMRKAESPAMAGLPAAQMNNTEKAVQWEKLNAEKERIEKIIRTASGFRRG